MPTFVPEGYSLSWEDSFDGPEIDTTNWVVASLRDPISGDLVPGAKGDHLLNYGYAGYITDEDTFIEDGTLVLRNQKRSYEGESPTGTFDYTSGWVMSMHRVHFNKGYMEIRAQFPSGDKVWPAMWLISEQLVWCPEWDMWEYFGFRDELSSQYDNMGTHLCYDGWPNQKWSSNFLSNFDEQYDCEAWHIYGFEWTATEAKWFLDGELVHTVTATSLGANQGLWPNEEMYIVLNNGQRSESPDETTLWPNYLKIDFIRLYQED
jgi:beta-glucanase (GH16 family)